jgi:hypothetical protein
MRTIQELQRTGIDTFVGPNFEVTVEAAARSAAKIAPDMHAGVYKVFFAAWTVFMGIFWVTFAPSSQTLFLLAFISIYALVFFGLPVWMNRKGRFMECGHGDFGDFLRGRVATIDGSVSGWEALIQVVWVPACLSVGGIVIGFIINASRFSY